MRAILAIILVAVIAFAAGASGVASRLLGNAQSVTAPAGVPVPNGASTATALSAATTSTTDATATITGTTTASGGEASSTPALAASPTVLVAPATPRSLDQIGPNGLVLKAGGWINGTALTAQVAAPAGAKGLSVDVEARPVGRAFTGTPTDSAPVHGTVANVVFHGLSSGRYHWQARLASRTGSGPWTPYAHGAAAFGVQTEPPAAPGVSSPTNPQRGVAYATPNITFHWTAPDDAAGVIGYSYRLDKDPHGEARKSVRAAARGITLFGLGTGTYYFHVRALDAAGNWGDDATYPVRVDVTPPELAQHIFSSYYFNPALENLTLDYKVTKASTVTVGIYDAGGVRVRHLVLSGLKLAGVPQQVAWDGRDDKGKLAPAGTYELAMRTTDRLGNSKVVGDWGGFKVTYRRIVVSLSQQRLFAYDGPTPFLSTLVTTGNRELPTPTGIFRVMFAKSPFTFHSPWPKGSKYYYEPSTANYALYFKDSGYFIHDAPWRSSFGPGTNQTVGAPGQNYTGTHGCVNVPEDAMKSLYAWAMPGTPVQIIN